MPIANTIRDRIARLLTAEMEPKRQALRYIIHQRELPLVVRVKAQLELQKMSRYCRPAAIQPRCIVGGRTRNIVFPFKLSPTEFRNKALNGELPGVRTSLW
ncbi:40S ribosomal protein mrp2, mitochondrial [Boothiomyces sp. JEL0866]|nr:40S ribosomal protein mrp2, mitochondrial [Boothiomyces sp. JEL0866]